VVLADLVVKGSPLGVDTVDFIEHETTNANSPIDDSPLVDFGEIELSSPPIRRPILEYQPATDAWSRRNLHAAT
jgi:hypothetical protein